MKGEELDKLLSITSYKPIFDFLKYVKPVWYNNIPAKSPIWISDVHKKYLNNQIYRTELARFADSRYQAWTKGEIPVKDAKIADQETVMNIYDNYVFLRRYFSKVWVYYALIIRILSLKNPIKEVKAFVKSRNQKRYPIHKELVSKSPELITDNLPRVSVIIPTLNRYEYLKDVLDDLKAQDYPDFEVIVIDQSDPFIPSFYSGYGMNITVEHQEERALWKARNRAITLASGEYVLLFDDDSRIEKDWIKWHVTCVQHFNAEISSGVSFSKVGDRIPETYKYFKLSDQLDTGNVLIKKSVFLKTGLFDLQFEKQRMGDGEFGLRCHLLGIRNISNPRASRLHLKVGQGGLRQMGSWDAYRTKKWLGPRPVPSVLYFFRRYFGVEATIYHVLVHLPASYIPYRFKSNRYLMLTPLLLFPFLFPLMVFSFYQSWKHATRKIDEGPNIDQLIKTENA